MGRRTGPAPGNVRYHAALAIHVTKPSPVPTALLANRFCDAAGFRLAAYPLVQSALYFRKCVPHLPNFYR